MRLSDESVREDRHLTLKEQLALQAQEIKRLQEKRFELEDKVKQLEAQVTRYRKALEKIASGSWLPHRRIASEAISNADAAMEGQEDFA